MAAGWDWSRGEWASPKLHHLNPGVIFLQTDRRLPPDTRGTRTDTQSNTVWLDWALAGWAPNSAPNFVEPTQSSKKLMALSAPCLFFPVT